MENNKEEIQNEDLAKVVKSADSPLKQAIVNYTGQALKPENDSVTLQMIIEVLANEFPEILLAVAEENFIRGYRSAMEDIDQNLTNNKQSSEKENNDEN
jgi:hypothetical protein